MAEDPNLRLLLDVSALLGGGVWFRDLEAKVHNRQDLLIYLAWYRLRHPRDPEDDETVREQQAEALALLRSG